MPKSLGFRRPDEKIPPIRQPRCRTRAKGDCKALLQHEKEDTIWHEQKHYDLWREFIDEWNADIANSTETFDSCDAINAYIEAVFIPAFSYSAEQMNNRQQAHCPDFANEILYGMDKCGNRSPAGRRICP